MTNTCFSQWLKKAKEQYETKDGGGVHTIWHGTRRKEDKETIKKKGFCTWGSSVDALHDVIEALDHFGKLDKIKDVFVQNQIKHICRFDREGEGLYVDVENKESQKETFKFVPEKIKKSVAPRTCSYANNNPEIISATLAYAGVKPEDIKRYLREKYGKPYAIKLKGKIKTAFPILNQGTGCLCFEPEDIEEVYECPEE